MEKRQSRPSSRPEHDGSVGSGSLLGRVLGKKTRQVGIWTSTFSPHRLVGHLAVRAGSALDQSARRVIKVYVRSIQVGHDQKETREDFPLSGLGES